MRKLLPFLAIAAFFSFVGLTLAAEDKTLTGKAVCKKCALKEAGATECQNVLQVEEDGKTVNYYLEGDVSDKAHKAMGICTAKKDAGIKIKVTGKLETENGKKVIEVTKIEKAD